MTLLDARPKLGGLNEYGLASYKTAGNFAQKEVEWLLSIGGIEVRTQQQMGRDFTLDSLLASHDAVFLGLGLQGVNALGIAEPSAAGLRNAVDFIAELRQSTDLSTLPVGRRVVVIGGGMTAVDAAVQSRKLGAEEVTIVYRRGADAMSASVVEQQWAQTNGVTIRHWAAPQEVLCENGAVTGVRFAATALDASGKLTSTGETFTLAADMVLKAIGQTYVAEPAGQPKGGIVVLQEIFGVNAHIRAVADGYAAAGYFVVAPATFSRIGKGEVELGYTEADMKEGMGLKAAVEALPAPGVIADIQAAVDHAAQAGKVGIVGYCWGGLLTWRERSGVRG